MVDTSIEVLGNGMRVDVLIAVSNAAVDLLMDELTDMTCVMFRLILTLTCVWM